MDCTDYKYKISIPITSTFVISSTYNDTPVYSINQIYDTCCVQ